MLFDTGFARYWPDRVRYLGTDARGTAGVAQLHFPGLSTPAARWLVRERAIRAVGLDTASIDPGSSASFDAHRVLAAAGVPALENLSALDALPLRDFTVVALPMKIRAGSGAPLRIVALVSDEAQDAKRRAAWVMLRRTPSPPPVARGGSSRDDDAAPAAHHRPRDAANTASPAARSRSSCSSMGCASADTKAAALPPAKPPRRKRPRRGIVARPIAR